MAGDLSEQEQLDRYMRAGKIAGKALALGRGLMKEGAMVRDVLDQVEEYIRTQGAQLAFPAQSSLNACAAHYCPGVDDETRYSDGDLAKLDVGVMLDGYIADNACTVAIGSKESERNLRLIKASREALNAAIKLCTPGTPIWKLGKAIEDTIKAQGFFPVRNLSGHGLARYEIHSEPSIPNFNNNDPTMLSAGQVIAIEPFSTTGIGLIYAQADAEVFSQEVRRNVRNQMARDVLAKIAPLNGVPFCLRHLSRQIGAGKARFGISELIREGIVHPHGPLVEKSGGAVAQSEHTIIIAEKPIVTTDVGEGFAALD